MATTILRPGILRGLDVLGPDGVVIGRVGDTWPLDGGGDPELLLIRVGHLFPSLRYLPARGAVIRDGKLHVPWTKLQLDDAPPADDHRWGGPADVARAYWMMADDGE
jgi:hypothetical protein